MVRCCPLRYGRSWPGCGPSVAQPVPEGSGAGRLGWVLALGFLGHLVEEGLGADGLLAVDGSQRFGHGLVRLGGLDDGAVGLDGRSDDQGEREGVAWTGVNPAMPCGPSTMMIA